MKKVKADHSRRVFITAQRKRPEAQPKPQPTAEMEESYQVYLAIRKLRNKHDRNEWGGICSSFTDALIQHLIEASGSENETYDCLMRCVITDLIRHAPDWKGRAQHEHAEAEAEVEKVH